MRILWLWMLSYALGIGGTAPDILVLTGSRDAKPVRIAFLKMQLALEQEETLASLFSLHGVTPKIRTFGETRALVVEPVRSLAARNALVLALSRRYPEMFFVSRISTGAVAKKALPPSKAGTHIRMEPLDWIWAAIFLLAFVGLVSSLYQRRRMHRFAREQSSLQADQERMDGVIETLGENNG